MKTLEYQFNIQTKCGTIQIPSEQQYLIFDTKVHSHPQAPQKDLEKYKEDVYLVCPCLYYISEGLVLL